ncbi:hypothetical protein AB6A40_005256 [Gnathostoma spinigerum]|uniref:Uncharacterized protein n=1 Tax=Gnathostoma spinigerum TaxID=75299 RepID=A0ABD6EPR3_9BILA
MVGRRMVNEHYSFSEELNGGDTHLLWMQDAARRKAQKGHKLIGRCDLLSGSVITKNSSTTEEILRETDNCI